MGKDDINIHPADELAAVREEIKILQAREDILRAAMLSGSDEDREGRNYRAFIQASTRETLDKEALIAEFGRNKIEPFLKKTDVKSVKLAKKEA